MFAMNKKVLSAKVVSVAAVLVIAGIILPTAAFASGSITNVTLDPSSATPGQAVVVNIDASTSGSGCTNNWRRTRITVNGFESVFNYPLDTQFVSGSYSQSHEIAAPTTIGEYEVLVEIFTGPEDSEGWPAGLDCAYSLLDSTTVTLRVSEVGSIGGSTEPSPYEGVLFCWGVPCPTEDESEDEAGGTTETGELDEATEESLAVETIEETACSAYLTSFIGLGDNNADDVKKLQEFLNVEMGSTLDVNGIFDDATREVVKAFQLKYADEILAPWVPFGLSADEPTGVVYKTTQRMINMLSCPGTEIPMPELP